MSTELQVRFDAFCLMRFGRVSLRWMSDEYDWFCGDRGLVRDGVGVYEAFMAFESERNAAWWDSERVRCGLVSGSHFFLGGGV